MSSFTRYAAVAVVVLSLGFLVASAPTTSYATIPAVTGQDAVSLVVAKLCVGLEAHLKALVACETQAQLHVAIGVFVSVLKTCADDLLKIGANAVVEVDAQANIAASVCAMITLFAQVCVQLIAKFGIKVVIDLCAQVDVALRACLVNLDICIVGIVAAIIKTLASLTLHVLAQVQLKLCLGVLGL